MTAGPVERIAVDAAVVGSGPAGISAAVTLRELGKSVAVVDEGSLPGGQIWRHATGADRTRAAVPWLERFDRSGARRLGGATVIDARVSPPGVSGLELVVEHEGKPIVIRASALMLATGARERFLPFPGWTLPGVVGVGGVQALAKSGMSVAGKRVVLAGSGPLLLPVAAHLAKQGARLGVVAEQANRTAVAGFALGLWRTPSLAIAAAQYRTAFAGARFRLGTWITHAAGRDRVEEATLTDGRRSWRVGCDLLAVAFGLVPSTELGRLLGCATQDGAIVVDEYLRTNIHGVFAIGECAGVAGVDAALIEGEIAGRVVAGDARRLAPLLGTRNRLRARAKQMDRAFALRPELRALATPKTIVCRCEDVPLGDLRAEWSARQAKLYCRAGMGACQGRVCGPALHFLFGWEPDTVRAPIQPARVSTLAPEPIGPSGVAVNGTTGAA